MHIKLVTLNVQIVTSPWLLSKFQGHQCLVPSCHMSHALVLSDLGSEKLHSSGSKSEGRETYLPPSHFHFKDPCPSPSSAD